MPPLKIPETLFTASVKTFSCRFLIESYAGNRTGYFIHSLNSLPVRIYNVVVADIIKQISMCDLPYSEEILLTPVLTSAMSEKLTHLDLSYFDLHGDLFPHFNEALLRVSSLLTNLVHLNISLITQPSTCNDDILCSIGKYCNLLKYLNINCNRVTDQALLCLIPSDDYKGCPELENLEIRYCNVAASTVAQLLERLPNIRNINYGDMDEALLLFHRSLKCNKKNFVLRLKSLSLHHSYDRPLDENCKICGTEETPFTSCLSNLCPEIESVFVSCIRDDVPMLKFFTKLTSSAISFYNSFGMETIYSLTNYGTQLTSLKIFSTTFHSNLFLSIGKSCPSLRELSVTCDYLVNNLKFEPAEEKTLKIFTLLSSFSLVVMNKYSNVPISILQLFKNTRSLTHLLFRCDIVTGGDEGFKEYWNMINTQSLVSILFSLAISVFNWQLHLNLTMSTVRLILDSCPELKELGELATWKVYRKEVELLKTSLKESNYDVEIMNWQDYNKY